MNSIKRSLVKISPSIALGVIGGLLIKNDSDSAFEIIVYHIASKRINDKEKNHWYGVELLNFAYVAINKSQSVEDLTKLYDVLLKAKFISDKNKGIRKPLCNLIDLAIKFRDLKLCVGLVDILISTHTSWAHTHYLKGWVTLLNPESISKAILSFDKAIELDSSYRQKIINDSFCSKHPSIYKRYS